MAITIPMVPEASNKGIGDKKPYPPRLLRPQSCPAIKARHWFCSKTPTLPINSPFILSLSLSLSLFPFTLLRPTTAPVLSSHKGSPLLVPLLRLFALHNTPIFSLILPPYAPCVFDQRQSCPAIKARYYWYSRQSHKQDLITAPSCTYVTYSSYPQRLLRSQSCPAIKARHYWFCSKTPTLPINIPFILSPSPFTLLRPTAAPVLSSHKGSPLLPLLLCPWPSATSTSFSLPCLHASFFPHIGAGSVQP